MLFETLLLLALGGVGTFLIGIPFYRFVKAIVPPKRDPLAEARERLEVAKAEAEAAKLHKEADKLVEETYHDLLDEDDDTNKDNKRRMG